MRQRADAAKHPSKRMIAATHAFYAAAKGIEAPPIPKARAKPINWEHIEQVHAIYKWDHELCKQYGLPHYALYAVPNSAKRSQALGRYMKAEGLRAGAPDLVLDVARGPWHGLRIELKRVDGGVQSVEQKAYQDYYATAGIRHELCHGANAAIAAIKEYLDA